MQHERRDMRQGTFSSSRAKQLHGSSRRRFHAGGSIAPYRLADDNQPVMRAGKEGEVVPIREAVGRLENPGERQVVCNGVVDPGASTGRRGQWGGGGATILHAIEVRGVIGAWINQGG